MLMGWMKQLHEQIGKKPPEVVEPFLVNITDEEYMALPWTVSWDGGTGWTCTELGVSSEDAETFDTLCRVEARQELSRAVDGKAPKLPTGLIWKEGKPSRDPGKVRHIDTKRY
jgi:hypothetical protein